MYRSGATPSPIVENVSRATPAMMKGTNSPPMRDRIVEAEINSQFAFIIGISPRTLQKTGNKATDPERTPPSSPASAAVRFVAPLASVTSLMAIGLKN